jgi:hypothetical protein
MDAHHDFNRRRTAVKRIIILALGVLLALALATPMALAQVGQGNKTGSAAKLAEAWTQWAYARHAAESPVIGEDPEYSEVQCDGTPLSTTQGNTWFLAGTEGGSAEETVRTCTVPAETQLFFPIVSATFFITFPPDENKQVARDYVKNFIRAVEEDPDLSIVVTVDGEEISSDQIVRAKTSFFPLTFPEDNLYANFGVEAGTYQTITNGLWLTLPPLPPGEHTIHFELSAPNADVFQNNTYHLTVVN